ncbi:MAG: stage II sporulation protein M [Nanoarchaeota archaeon]
MFEQLYKEEWLESKARFAFLLGMSYSVFGIFSAMVLFPDDPGMASVAFTSLLLVPSIHTLLTMEASKMASESRFSLARLFWDHSDILTIYFFVFIGSLLTFGFFSAMWPPVATSAIFASQSKIAYFVSGRAAASGQFMMDLLANNARVLLICLLMSFFYGAGSVFILIWNASAWGVIFGLAAKQSAAGATHPVLHFFYTILLVSPHLVLEAGSYFFAATAGGIISKGVIREKFLSPRFNRVIQDGLYLFLLSAIFVVIAAYVEAYFTPWILATFR